MRSWSASLRSNLDGRFEISEFGETDIIPHQGTILSGDAVTRNGIQEDAIAETSWRCLSLSGRLWEH